MADRATLFISYARADDEPFAQRLYADLTARGFAVWWDREKMDSRGRTFLQEIRDAIATVERLILVVGPQAAQSDYVRAEWAWALEACTAVLPILRLGDYSLVPGDLAGLHCPDFRASRPYEEGLAELLRLLAEPVPPRGALPGVPELPPHFQPRAADLAALEVAVLADLNRPLVITSARRTTALQGMGGIGKSVLAAAFARACGTRRAFGDGVIWLPMGQQPELLRSLVRAGQALSDDPQHYVDIEYARDRLAHLLEDKVCLLVLDDVWDVAHAEVFVNALGDRARLLITTREGGLVTALGAQEHRLDVLSDEAALALLADWAAQPVEELPAEAIAVADECGNLPFALALSGAMARDGVPWADLLEALREADLAFLERRFPNYPHPDVLRALAVSVDALARVDPAGARHYRELAVFPAHQPVPEAAVLTLWLHTNGLRERDARKLLTTLERKALLRLDGATPERLMSLHDLQHDYLRAIQGDLISLHEALVMAYRQQCVNGWPSGPDDGYFFGRLPYHLAQAGRHQELAELLLDFNWLHAKLGATDIVALLADYELGRDYPDARMVQGTIRLSAHVLSQDPTQLAGQLIGRLLSQDRPAIRRLLDQATEWKVTPWLRPMTLSLIPAGGPLLRTLEGHTSEVGAVVVTPDGRRAVSGSWDGTLKVWDLGSGAALHTLEGHTRGVTAVAVTPDGRRAVSPSDDHTLRVWDLRSGTKLHTLEGHADTVMAVAVTPDGRRAVSGSGDGSLEIWDLERGAALHTLEGHAFAAPRPVLQLWDLERGPAPRALEGRAAEIWAVAVTPDGRRAVSASDDHTLRVWDLDTGAIIARFTGEGAIFSCRVTSNGQTITAHDAAGRLHILRLEGIDPGRDAALTGGQALPPFP